jgi:citrate lyase subunit beta / citryl-CoA lyase
MHKMHGKRAKGGSGMRLHNDADLPAWRSLLFVPVNVPHYVGKAHQRGADAIILDLEDSVPLAEKDTARGMVAEAAREVGRDGADVLVRVNQPLELCVRDIESSVSPQIAALMLPKIDSASHVRLLAELIDRVEAAKGMTPGHTKLYLLVETAEAFARLGEIAGAHPRNVAISLGVEDFATSTNSVPESDVVLYPKQQTVIAACAAGILPMGTIGSVANFGDDEANARVIRNSRRFGFRGSACIHPRVVPLLNEGFGASAEEIAAAERILAGFEQAKAQGRASIAVDGKMIDYPIVERAQHLLDRHKRAEARRRARP